MDTGRTGTGLEQERHDRDREIRESSEVKNGRGIKGKEGKKLFLIFLNFSFT